MSNCGFKYIVYASLFFVHLLYCTEGYSQRANRIERRAERLFLYGDHTKSMHLYERALLSTPVGTIPYYILELKIATQYFALNKRSEVISHYRNVYINADTLFSADDIYRFTDALRRSGAAMDAERVFRHYAFTGSRYLDRDYISNSLNSISNRAYHPEGIPSDHDATLLRGSDAFSNYWIGDYHSELVFAQSRREELVNESKVAYHNTHFSVLTPDSIVVEPSTKDAIFRDLPQALQQGPMTYSKSLNMLVATDITHTGNREVVIGEMSSRRYSSQLIYSIYDSHRKLWTSLNTIFDDDQVCSYAHPEFINGGDALLFCSNRSGGYGGMDIYISYWSSDEHRWCEPRNLGPSVNSEFDELYPRVYGDKLLFASNGLDGFGGFDNYHILWYNDAPLAGTLFHYPPPINSVYNDFGMYINDKDGFFISDRGDSGVDNIFTIINTPTSLARRESIGVLSESYAMNTDVGFLESSISGGVPERRILTGGSQFGILNSAITNREFVVYFDFDSHKLTENSHAQLDDFISKYSNEMINNVSIVGYTDLVGTVDYNKQLSLDRAASVANYIEGQLPNTRINYDGKGIIEITRSDKIFLGNQVKSLIPKSRDFTITDVPKPPKIIYYKHRQAIIHMLKPYRRVEIELKIKQ